MANIESLKKRAYGHDNQKKIQDSADKQLSDFVEEISSDNQKAWTKYCSENKVSLEYFLKGVHAMKKYDEFWDQSYFIEKNPEFRDV